MTQAQFRQWHAAYRRGEVWLPEDMFPQPKPGRRLPRVLSCPQLGPKEPTVVQSVSPVAVPVGMAVAPAKTKRAKRGEGYMPGQRQAQWMRRDPCVYCGGPSDSWDHIEPRKRGGKHIDNLARVCHSCNHEKSSRPLLTFLAIRAQRKAVGTWKRMPGLKLRGGRKAS